MQELNRSAGQIRTRPAPTCILCGSTGAPLYSGLQDRMYQASGVWDLKRCSGVDCGLVWLDPRPLEDDLPNAYCAYYTHALEASRPQNVGERIFHAVSDAFLAHRYGHSSAVKSRVLWPFIYLHPGVRAEAEFSVLYQLDLDRTARLLDVGCGSGSHLKSLVNLGCEAVEGVDPDPQAVDLAVRRGLRVQCGTVRSQNYPDSTFDVITMSHVIEHLHDPVDVLKECYRILRPGGKLLVTTPNMDSWGHRMFRGAWLHLDPPRHLFLFNHKNLLTAVRRSGLWSLTSIRSTIHAAGPTLDASLNIRKTGRHERSFLQASFWRQSAAHAFYYAEAMLLPVMRWRGEEILVRAEKPT